MTSVVFLSNSTTTTITLDGYGALARFPVELLGQIFIRTLPPFETFETPSYNSSPIVLCCVNKYWREVALGTPQLWSIIRLGSGPGEYFSDSTDFLTITPITATYRDANKKQLDPVLDRYILSKYIERAGIVPLSLALTYPIRHPSLANYPAPVVIDVPSTDDIVYKKPFDLALQYINRWQHIILTSHILDRAYIATFFSERLPFLETLIVGSTHIDSVVLTSQPLIPHRAFTFDEDFHRPSEIWFPNLRNLTFTGASLSMADLFLLFMHMPLLESCSVQLYRGGHLAFGPELLIMPKLRKLDLLVGRDFNLAMLLDRLILPNLECLKLTAAGMSSVPMWVDAAKLLRRSTKKISSEQLYSGIGNVWNFNLEDIENLPEKESTLKELRLIRHPMTPMPARDVLQCLHAAPNIEVLHMSGAYLTDEVLAGLTLTTSSNSNEYTMSDWSKSTTNILSKLNRELDDVDRTLTSYRPATLRSDSFVRGRVLSIESVRRTFGMGLVPLPLDYCPRLQSIRLNFPGAFLFSAPAIRRMILSRCNVNSNHNIISDNSTNGLSGGGTERGYLKELHISKCNPEVVEYVLHDSDVVKCMEGGLDLRINKSLEAMQ